MFERFTDDARRVIVDAQQECSALGNRAIGTEHLLLALLHDDDPLVAGALVARGLTLLSARASVARLFGGGNEQGSFGHIPFTTRTKRTMERAVQLADESGQSLLGPAHLLVALLELPDSGAVRVLVDCGVDVDALSGQADELRRATESGDVSEGAEESGESPSPGDRVRRTLAPRPGRRQGPRGRALAYGSGPQEQEGLAGQVDRLVTERRELGDALRQYGRHAVECDPESGCSCGFQAVLDGLDPATGS